MTKMLGDSFVFNGINFREKFNIRVVKVDYLLPSKRERKIEIPNRNGLYDFGSVSYNERIIKIACDLLSPLSRAQLREISYLLDRKGKLYLWDEPDKYYIGEIYMAPEIMEFPKAKIRTFDLEFKCEPFAYREQTFDTIEQGTNKLKYYGTAKAPCRIEITNHGNVPANKIILSTTRKKRGI